MTITINIRFKKLSETLYRVSDTDKIVGVVRKVEFGNAPPRWSAQTKGRVIGYADTRAAAARLLVSA